MKNRVPTTARIGTFTALALSATLLAGCASSPESPLGSGEARSNLSALQTDPNLAERAPDALREAEVAVRLAEEPLPASEARLAEHRVFMAEQKVEIARARATTEYTDARRERLGEERDEARLAARTEEADKARRSEAALQRQIETLQAEATERGLQAEATERGMVLTLGDVLFATGSAELRHGGDGNLDRLVDFLNQHAERRVLIEGHTDSVGNAQSNQRLSERRAAAVRSNLIRRGISPARLSASGAGQDRPVASNDTASGRQQNRRVEVIIENAPDPETSAVGS